MSAEFKPLDKVISDGDMGQLMSKIDDDRWVVFDYDLNDEVIWNVRTRDVQVVD